MPRLHTRTVQLVCCALLAGGFASVARATPDYVEHIVTNQVYGEAAGVTMRDPDVPREDEAVAIWVRIGYSFYYDNVAVYYTTDGSTPSGTKGTPSGTTAALTFAGGQVAFVRNEPSNIDWWKATLPVATRSYGATVKYRISAWHSGGGAEIFANNYGCSDGTCDNPSAPATTFSYTVRLAWPGKGAPYVDHAAGYPPVYFWKEEGVVGNNYMNVMVDQNGAVYDVYYPSAGCVYGMGTKNEGYVDGLDTFPPGLPAGSRGQMNLNQAMGGIRIDGVTYWLTNENAAGYSDVSQTYIPGTNVIHTAQRLTAGGNNIQVNQYDFCPKGITFPLDDGGQPNRGLYIKRFVLTNNGGSSRTLNFYFYSDHALNGGDSYDEMLTDAARGAMVASDVTQRWTSASGEYNPTTTGDYNKSVSVYLATAMKVLGTVGGAGGTPATDFWSDTSTDEGQGWVGVRLTLPAGGSKEIDVAYVGGFDNFAAAGGTYAWQMEGPIDWFLAGNMSTVQATTESYWTNWLASGVTVDTPDDAYDEVLERGLLATALHLDGKNGGVIAGMHNGAYPFIWPRDAVWAAITLDRTGHTAESAEVYRYLRDVAYRANDSWGKGFWYQKYTTDGYIVWSAPQVDETSAVPWGAYYHYRLTGDASFLSNFYTMIYEASRASSEDSTIDSRLYYNDPVQLMYSNNLWEDSWDVFLYSNASVERGLRDAAAIATVLGHSSDASLFTGRADAIHSGIGARLAWDGENTDISQLGPVYPFAVYGSKDPLMAHVVDRMNGVATDRNGNNHPIMNTSGEFNGLVNRYWGDTYWNGGPWFLNTLWYGAYYAVRQNDNPGKGDIDNHKYRCDLLLDRLGPIGLGAEQIAPTNSLLYPGQTDFSLQAAWPNAWESMSFLVDAVMLFLDYTPDAPGNTLRIAPKLPTEWSTMTFSNIALGSHRIDVTCSESATFNRHLFTNRTGAAANFDTYVRVPAGTTIFAVTRNGSSAAYTYDSTNGRVHVTGALATGASAATDVRVYYGRRGDGDGNGSINGADYDLFAPCMTGPGGTATPACAVFDFEPDGDVDLADFARFADVFGS